MTSRKPNPQPVRVGERVRSADGMRGTVLGVCRDASPHARPQWHVFVDWDAEPLADDEP